MKNKYLLLISSLGTLALLQLVQHVGMLLRGNLSQAPQRRLRNSHIGRLRADGLCASSNQPDLRGRHGGTARPFANQFHHRTTAAALRRLERGDGGLRGGR